MATTVQESAKAASRYWRAFNRRADALPRWKQFAFCGVFGWLVGALLAELTGSVI